MRLLLRRYSTVILHRTFLVLGAMTASVAPASAADLQDLLNAPVWYLEFDVSFKASFDTSYTSGQGTMTTTISLDRTFSASWPLDLRNQGPSPILGASFLGGNADGSQPSMEEQMKMAQAMMARMETAANWMSTGGALTTDENATEEEAAAAGEASMNAAMGPAKLDYTRVDDGKNLVDEMGGRYDLTTTTTRKGAGKVLAGGGQGVTFEIDAASKQYALVLPTGFNAMLANMTIATHSLMTPAGGEPVTTQQSSDVSMDLFPSDLEVDDPRNMRAGMAFIRGEIDPAAGQITGEQTMAAHYTDQQLLTVHGTMTFRYTLTTTPPIKSKSPGN